jgi:hypothetical protein
MDFLPQSLHRQAGVVSVWHPQTLDVDGLLETYGQRVGEGVLWLGHCVLVGMANDKRNRKNGYVPLMTEYLRNVIGRHDVDAVRDAAHKVGYVNRNRSYRAGHSSQTYWILPPYNRAPLVRRQISHGGLRYKILKWHEDRRRMIWQRIQHNETSVDAAVRKHLWRNLQRVQIDAEIDFGAAFDPLHQIVVEYLREGELWFTVDDYGRIHTNLTNMPKTLRRYLSVDGKRLIDVDIGESQPLFMGMALARSEESATVTQEHTEREREGDRHPLSLMMDSIMMDKNPQVSGKIDRACLSPDLRSYLALCESRGLYQAVANQLGSTRDKTKNRVMVALYAKPSLRTPVRTVLERLFPSVMQAMRRIKTPNHRRLAHFAQRIESQFMFGRVMSRIMEERPDLFVSTIHDSILTTDGDADFVRQVMLDEFTRMGLSPQVNIEPCSGVA